MHASAISLRSQRFAKEIVISGGRFSKNPWWDDGIFTYLDGMG